MTGNEYQKLAMRTCNFDLDSEWSLQRDSEKCDAVHHGVFGLCAEAGEVAGIYQKAYQGHPCEVDHLIKELGDCLWMIAEICSAYGIEFNDVMETNIEKLKKRYPDGFDTEKSLKRNPGDI